MSNNTFNFPDFQNGSPAYTNEHTHTYIGIAKSYPGLITESNDGKLHRFRMDGDSPSHKNNLRMNPSVQIDWSKMPVDTPVDTTRGIRYFSRFKDNSIFLFTDGKTSLTQDEEAECGVKEIISINPNQIWTFWQGGNCPIPDGLEYEIIYRNGCWKKVTDKLVTSLDTRLPTDY